MTIGLALTGLVALGVHMLAVTTDPGQAAGHARSLLLTSFGVTLYATPLKYLVMLAPLAFVFFFSFRHQPYLGFDRERRVLCFRGGDGLVLIDDPACLYRDIGGPRILRDGGSFRRLEPLRLHDETRLGAHGGLLGHGRLRPCDRDAG